MTGRWDSKKSKTKELIAQYLLGMFVPFGSIKLTKGFLIFFTIMAVLGIYNITQSITFEHVELLVISSALSVIFYYSYKLVKERGKIR